MTMMWNTRPATDWRGALGQRWAALRRRAARAADDARLRADLRHLLDQLDREGELDQVLGTLGLARGGIPLLLQRYPDAVRRHAAMQAKLGAGTVPQLDRAALATIFGAGRACVHCSAAARCDQWVAAGARSDAYRSFCPGAKAPG